MENDQEPALGAGFWFTGAIISITLPTDMPLSFAKYQALENSFIVLDKIHPSGRSRHFARLAIKLCRPSSGIGADGLLVLSRKQHRFRVDIYNADGTWAEKSGNGVRIAALHLLIRGMVSGPAVELATGSGVSTVTFHGGSENRRLVSASLGKPVFETALIPVDHPGKYFINQPIKCGHRSFIASAVSVGNPHLILFCRNFDFDWKTIGAQLETAPLFPQRINVGFVALTGRGDIEVRDWERGVGPTQSSGTGAAAAVAVSVLRGFTDRRVTVHTPAGMLAVRWDRRDDTMIIKGPVALVCRGEYH
jgi:diaminopimelate epimerase